MPLLCTNLHETQIRKKETQKRQKEQKHEDAYLQIQRRETTKAKTQILEERNTLAVASTVCCVQHTNGYWEGMLGALMFLTDIFLDVSNCFKALRR